MAAVQILQAFAYKWAQDGTAAALDDSQYKAGWAFIGATPPSVEQFNKVHQIADEKSNWLYGQVKAVTDAAGLVLAAGTSTTLRDAMAKSGIVGASRNVNAFIASPGNASVVFTADEIVLKTAIGGLAVVLSAFNKTLNTGTTGAGGMDTGTAPASAWVAIYAIYNPTTGVSALLGQSTTGSALRSEVYSGANMPAGYTHSALLMVWPTTAGSILLEGGTRDRRFSQTQRLALSTSVVAGVTLINPVLGLPANAKRVRGYAGYQSTVSTSVVSLAIGGTSTLQDGVSGQALGQGSLSFDIQIPAPQTFYWQAANGSGTYGANIYTTGYEI